MIALLLMSLLGMGADVITVDDDGPADYTTIADALAASHPGDVITVAQGDYGPFIIDRAVSIVGTALDPLPRVTGYVLVKASRATLAGLEFGVLVVTGASDRVVIDDCTMGKWVPITPLSEALVVSACAEIIVSRCRIQGSQDWQQLGGAYSTGDAVRVEDSHVVFVDCELTGGDGASDVGSSPYTQGYDGGAPLVVLDSTVEIAGSRLKAGHGGYGAWGLSDMSGEGGHGLIAEHSTVVVRGSATDYVKASFSLGQASPGFSALLTDGSSMVLSGVQFDDFVNSLDNSKFVHPANEPWLEIFGEDTPGAVRTIQLHGSGAGDELGILYLGFVDDLVQLPVLEAPLWLDPVHAQLILYVAVDPVFSLSLPLPASLDGLAGLTLDVQAVMVGQFSNLVPGTIIVTDPAPIVVRF